MKRIILYVSLAVTLTLGSCDVLKQIASSITPSELEMITGLKDGLFQGLFRAFNAFADPNGNPLVRFAFPGDAAKIEKTLRDLGMDKVVNDVTGKFTRAMSNAVTVAKPMFNDAVRRMTIRDAAKILVTDNTHAATDYFKGAMQSSLMTAFRPIVDSSIKVEGGNKDWSTITKVYNVLPFINKPLENNLTDFISARVIDGMFLMVANEEEGIRSKYELRQTDMMKKVFGWAEQELKKRTTGGTATTGQ